MSTWWWKYLFNELHIVIVAWSVRKDLLGSALESAWKAELPKV